MRTYEDIAHTLLTKKSFSHEKEKILEYVRIIRKLVKGNLLKQNGKARNTHYTIAE